MAMRSARSKRCRAGQVECEHYPVFHTQPGAVALMTPDLVFADANEAYLSLSGRTREQVKPARRLPHPPRPAPPTSSPTLS